MINSCSRFLRNVLLSILSFIQVIRGIELNCDFTDRVEWTETRQLYSCEMLKLIIKDQTTTVSNFSGNHEVNKGDKDVQQIAIRASDVSFIPQNLGGFFQLISLVVQEVSLVEIKAADFENMNELEYLSLAMNQLQEIPLDAFRKLKQLRKINLSLNFLEELRSGIFDENSNLEMIFVDRNRITIIGAYVFKDLHKLHFVNFKSTLSLNEKYNGTEAIVKLRNDILAFKSPYELITSELYPLQDKLNGADTNLIRIKIEHENMYLKRIVEEQEKELQELHAKLAKMNSQFDLECEFENLNEEYTCTATNVQILKENMELENVIGKHLSRKCNSDVSDLIVENSTMNYLSNDFFKTFPNLQNVVYLNANIRFIKKGDFNGAAVLLSVEMNGNSIRKLEDDIFEGADVLEIIKMEMNEIQQISEIAFKGLRHLKNLNLNKNNITELHPDTFKDLTSLRVLDLSNNWLTSLNGQLISHNTNLLRILFAKNLLSFIDENFINFLTNVKLLDLSKNTCIDECTKLSDLDDIQTTIHTNCNKPQLNAIQLLEMENKELKETLEELRLESICERLSL